MWVPIYFLFLVIEGKPEKCSSWFFEPTIKIGNHALGVKIDTSDINFLKAQVSLDTLVQLLFWEIPYYMKNKFFKWKGF